MQRREGPTVPPAGSPVPWDATGARPAARVEESAPYSPPEGSLGQRRPAGWGRAWGDGLGRAAIRSAQLLLVTAAITLVVMVLVRLRFVVVPLALATMIAAAVWPLVGWLRRRGVPRALAAWGALLTGAAGLTGLGWLVVAGMQGQWEELRDGAAEGLEELQRFLTSGPSPIDAEQIDRARDAVLATLSGEEARAQAVSGALLAAEVVAAMFLTVVVLFFLLKDGLRIWGFLQRAVPPDQRERSQRIGERCVDVLGGYVRGTTIVAVVDAVVIGVALALLGVPLALPLAVIVFLGAFVPLAGAAIAGAFAALIALVTNGPVTALIVVAVVIAVNQIEDDALAPLVLGRAVSLHPLVVLLALSGGAIIAGIIGALLAVPLVAVVWAVITAWDDDGTDGAPATAG